MRYENQEPARKCDDPTHGVSCTCGADPDGEYERQAGI